VVAEFGAVSLFMDESAANIPPDDKPR
jgi:hypothetical protein